MMMVSTVTEHWAIFRHVLLPNVLNGWNGSENSLDGPVKCLQLVRNFPWVTNYCKWYNCTYDLFFVASIPFLCLRHRSFSFSCWSDGFPQILLLIHPHSFEVLVGCNGWDGGRSGRGAGDCVWVFPGIVENSCLELVDCESLAVSKSVDKLVVLVYNDDFELVEFSKFVIVEGCDSFVECCSVVDDIPCISFTYPVPVSGCVVSNWCLYCQFE